MDTLQELAKRVRYSPTDPVFLRAWESLRAEGWTESDLKHPGLMTECVRELRSRLAAQTPRPRRQQAPPWIRQAFVLADLAATVSARNPAVQAFRSDVLQGRLLRQDKVPEWIRSRVGHYVGLDSLIAFQEDQHIARVPVTDSPELEQLQSIVRRLVDAHQWPEDTATVFVLTGQTPLRWPIRARIEIRASETTPTTTHIHLSVDPWVPASAVMDAYKRIRRHKALRDAHSARTRRASARQQALAVFTVAAPALSARDRLRQWNKTYPTWRYSDVRNFDRDSRRALAAFEHIAQTLPIG